MNAHVLSVTLSAFGPRGARFSPLYPPFVAQCAYDSPAPFACLPDHLQLPSLVSLTIFSAGGPPFFGVLRGFA
jgi:hypothetical protein